jgi:hypothetical protein
MITKCYILKILKDLDRGYNQSTSHKKATYYSKLALIELCGWIEESMDDVVLRCAKRNLKSPSALKLVEDAVIKNCYGFTYKKHFRHMLVQVIGLTGVERVETMVDPAIDSQFRSDLGNLKVARDAEAHMHLKGFTRSIDAPSLNLARFNSLYTGLKEYDRVIKDEIG